MRGKRVWWIGGALALVVILVAGGIVLALRSESRPMERLGQRVTGLAGVRWLLVQLNVDWAAPKAQAEQLLQVGEALEYEGRYQEALRAYERALELSPKDPQAYLGLASAYEALEEPDKALEQLEKAIEIAPQDGSVLRQLGRLQCLKGDHESCVATLERAVQVDPEDAMGHYWLALGYQNSAGDGLNKALSQYEQALRKDPDLARAHLALGMLYRTLPGKDVLAMEELKKAVDAALQADDQELAQTARSELARLYYFQDEYELCIDEWKQVLEANPDDPDAHRRLGLCHAMRRESGDLEMAVQELETALKLDFEHIDAYYFYLGQYYATQEEYARALLAWDQFLRFSDNEELNAQVRGFIEAYQQALREE